MGTAERRKLLLKILSRRRHEHITSLASEFGVFERTIRRDIEILSLTEPIYTLPGRYGGVYVLDGYMDDNLYVPLEEECLLRKILDIAENRSVCDLSSHELDLLKDIIMYYSKPKKPVK